MTTFRSAAGALRAALPQGRSLPAAQWRSRHETVVMLLVLHAALLPAWGVLNGHGVAHAVAEVVPLAVLALVGAAARSRALASSATSTGLVLSSALVLHFGGGHTFLHFHFFVMVGVLALYQDWLPFLLTIGLVLLDHGVFGAFHAHQVYDDPWSVQHPIAATAVHGGFVLAAAMTHVLTWGWSQRERETAEHRLAAESARVTDSERRLAEVIDNAPALVFVKDLDGRLIRVNPRFAEMHETTPEALLGKSAGDLFGHDDVPGLTAPDCRVLETGQPDEHEITLQFPAGERVLHVVKFPLLDADGQAYALAGVATDITERARAERALQRQAREDALTHLPNRTALHESVAAALAGPGLVGLAFLDLDGFKEVNDSLGHEAGDDLLRAVATELRAAVEGDAVLHRLGGDEFVLLMPDAGTEDAAVAEAERLIASLSRTFRLGDRVVEIGASCGVTSGRGVTGVTGSTLLRDADIALYEAKAVRRGGVTAYDPSFRERDERRRRLEGDLARALRGGSGLRLVYQPIADATSGAWALAEALIRWEHPDDGPLPPGDFLPLAASAGLLAELDRWVVLEACAQSARWRGRGLDLTISVNVSPTSLSDGRVAEWVREGCTATGTSPGRLVVELTETAVVEHPAAASVALAELRAMGVRVALDDFGTGFSSLSLLRDLPVDIVKIDRSFIVGSTDRDAAIVQATTGLAEALGLTTVAEGVEDAGVQVAALSAGCSLLQGWHVGMPVDPYELASLMVLPPLPAPRTAQTTVNLT